MSVNVKQITYTRVQQMFAPLYHRESEMKDNYFVPQP